VVLAYSWRSMVYSIGKEHGQNRGPTAIIQNKRKHSLSINKRFTMNKGNDCILKKGEIAK
jgi:hypothetical protein